MQGRRLFPGTCASENSINISVFYWEVVINRGKNLIKIGIAKQVHAYFLAIPISLIIDDIATVTSEQYPFIYSFL